MRQISRLDCSTMEGVCVHARCVGRRVWKIYKSREPFRCIISVHEQHEIRECAYLPQQFVFPHVPSASAFRLPCVS